VEHNITTKVGSKNIVTVENEELDVDLLIVKNARVMLTSNLWTKFILFNGALVYIQNIVYIPKRSPPDQQTYAMVEFDNYIKMPFEGASPQFVLITQVEKGRTR